MRKVDSGSVKPRKSHKTVCCTCCFCHIAQNCFLITMKHNVAWGGESSKRISDPSCRYFHKIFLLFYFNDISNCCVVPALLFIPTSPFINLGGFCLPPRLLRPLRLLFWSKFASLPVFSTHPFYLKLESMQK